MKIRVTFHTLPPVSFVALALLLVVLSLGAAPASASIDSGSFAPKVDFTTGVGPFGVASADLSGSGKLDLVVANRGPSKNGTTVSVLRNVGSSGNISFTSQLTFSVGTGPVGVAVGDIDGDGKSDVIVANETDNTISVLRNTSSAPGSISFAPQVTFTVGTGPLLVALADLDGDNRPDVVVTNWGGGGGNTPPFEPMTRMPPLNSRDANRLRNSERYALIFGPT